MAVVDVVIEAEAWNTLDNVEQLAVRACDAALGAAGVKTAANAELAVLLADDAAIAGLNERWRGKATATNVLSFPAAEGARLATSPMIGDIALAFETCAREAALEGKTLADHVTHLVVHGALHLLGFDHETDEDAGVMEALEQRILAGLGIADPYAPAGPQETGT